MSNFFVKSLTAVAAVACFQGCAGALVPINPALSPVSYATSSEQIPLHVGLLITDELRDSQWTKDGGGGGDSRCKLILGDLFVSNAKQLVDTVFTEVTVLAPDDDPAAAGVDAVLRPHMVSVERSRPTYIYQEQRTSVVFEWTLSRPAGGLIWADSVAAEGRGNFATKAAVNFWTCAEGLVEGAEIQIEDLMKDLFGKSHESMTTARAIREFAGALSS